MRHATEAIIITIDGPAGTGKSSVARALARRLGLDFLDTGAMYRAAAAVALDRGLDLADQPGVVRAVEEAGIRFDWSLDPPRVLAFDRPMNGRIRASDVTAVVSRVAAIAPLRRHMVAMQRAIAAQHPRLVTEGRDQGSVVFPDARVKLYLDADPAVRARRRLEQLRAAGGGAIPDPSAVLADIAERDRLDSSRADGPLRCPEDAIRVDTTSLSFEQVVSRLEQIVRERVGPL